MVVHEERCGRRQILALKYRVRTLLHCISYTLKSYYLRNKDAFAIPTI